MIINSLLKQGKDIAQGHFNEFLGLGKDLKTIRLEICKKCPIYLPTTGGICDHSKWLNPDTNEVSTDKKDGFYRGCGCRLQAKTTLPNAICPANKW